MRLLRPPWWSVLGACVGQVSREHDPWHPPSSLPRPERAAQYATARAVCAGCPVRLACAVEALTDAIGGGMWGGLTPEDRLEVAARFGYPRPGTPPHGQYARYAANGCRCDDCREAKRRYMAERTSQIGAAAHGRRSVA